MRTSPRYGKDRAGEAAATVAWEAAGGAELGAVLGTDTCALGHVDVVRVGVAGHAAGGAAGLAGDAVARGHRGEEGYRVERRKGDWRLEVVNQP